jgi:hypothetical protein
MTSRKLFPSSLIRFLMNREISSDIRSNFGHSPEKSKRYRLWITSLMKRKKANLIISSGGVIVIYHGYPMIDIDDSHRSSVLTDFSDLTWFSQGCSQWFSKHCASGRGEGWKPGSWSTVEWENMKVSWLPIQSDPVETGRQRFPFGDSFSGNWKVLRLKSMNPAIASVHHIKNRELKDLDWMKSIARLVRWDDLIVRKRWDWMSGDQPLFDRCENLFS